MERAHRSGTREILPVMSNENAELVRRCYDSLSRGDIDSALAETSDDFEMNWSNSIGPAKGIYRGRAEVRAVWVSYVDAFEAVRWDAGEINAIDESTMVVATRFRARGRGSGVKVDATGAQLWRFADGLAVGVELHQSRADALEAAGLSE